MKTTSQPMKPNSKAKKTTYDANINSQWNKNKKCSNGCRLIRSGRQVKEAPIQKDDSDSHDSYESAEDELYRPPKVVGDNLYSSDSDSDNLYSKSDVREKHKLPKARLGNNEIDTDDSSYEGSEDEQSSNSDLDDSNGASDADSWHSEDSDKESLAVYPKFNEKTKFGLLKFEVSMIFKSKSELMQAIRDYTIQWGRNILFSKNDKVKIKVVCKTEDCPWVVYCACNKQDGSWQIKTLVDTHTCPRRRKNRAATQTWILSKLVPKLRKHPTMKHRECNVYLNSTCVTRALKAARKVVEGDKIAQYGLVWDYANELLNNDPGSTIQLQLAVVAPGANGVEPEVNSVTNEHDPSPGEIAPFLALPSPFLALFMSNAFKSVIPKVAKFLAEEFADVRLVIGYGVMKLFMELGS
ncbi:hypothetical protein Ahy_A02g008306 [Arachis hypogaea]|uniref:Transposase MuDR plant domain-containing protein n=1 Tax=Arachis hypogaea TaxID=3818 RepID=A0A445EE44_ARAHY|nr:hypothetical protein Ahy_A02g008306 [Arachis hypogaea]